jgi:hypothetical protein
MDVGFEPFAGEPLTPSAKPLKRRAETVPNLWTLLQTSAYFSRRSSLRRLRWLGLVWGQDLVAQYRRPADYVARILKGEKPADLPVQTPTKS